MYYFIIEIQKQMIDGQVTVNQITTVHSTHSEAEQKYHVVLSYAAVSGLLSHSATMLDDKGYYIKSECYTNNPPEPEPELEVNNENE